MSVLELDLLELAFEELHCIVVFFLPLFGDFLLVHHHRVGLLFISLVTFFGFQQGVFKMGDFDVSFIVELIDATVEDNLETADLAHGALLLVTQLVDQLAETLVVIEVALVVSHVRVELDLLLMHHDLVVVLLVLDVLDLFLQALVLLLQTTHLLVAHRLLLVQLLVVALVFY